MISEFPLFLFTTLTGVAAGVLAASALFPNSKDTGRKWLFPLVMLVLIGVGAVASTTHLGRPQNMIYMLGNPAASLVLEGIFAGLTGLAVLVDFVLCARGREARAVRIVAAVLAVILLAVQAYAYATSYGNAAWRAGSVWAFFIVGSLGAGFGAWALFGDAAGRKSFALASAVLLVLAALAFVWEAVSFGAVGAESAQLIAGGVLALVGAVLEGASVKGANRGLFLGGMALGVAALCVARYGFYMASII